MGNAHDSEAISAYLTDLQNQIRAPSSTLSATIHLLAEPLSFLGLLPDLNTNAHANTNVNESYPTWRGPIEPTTAKRIYFIQHLLPNHLNFILDNVTLDWLSALPSVEQKALFDTYFVPATSELMAAVSLQTLVSRVNAQFHQNHTFLNNTILRLLRELIKTYSLQDFFRGCSQFGGSNAIGSNNGGIVDMTLWDSFLSRLFSIPTRVSNAFGAGVGLGMSSRIEVEECFQEKVFFKGQAVQLQKCLESISVPETLDTRKQEKKGEEVRIQHAKAFAVVVAKFMRLGYGRILIELVVSTLWNSDISTKASGWRLALLHASSSGTAQLFLSNLIEYFDLHQLDFSSNHSSTSKETLEEQQLATVHRAAYILISLGYGVNPEQQKQNNKKESDNYNNAMVNEILFQGRVYGTGVLRTLICIQSAWPAAVRATKDSVLARTFKKAMEIWSDAMLVNHASFEYQMLGYFDHQVMLDMELIPLFGAAMTNWLELENFTRKQIVLVVAEEFSRVVDTIGSPANFDLDGANPEIQFARSLVRLMDGAKPYRPEALTTAPVSSQSTVDSIADKDGGSTSLVDIDLSSQQVIDSDDEDDPDAIIDSFSKVPTAANYYSSDDDDDDDLKPYEMEDESDPEEDVGSTNRPKVAAPLYLRDLISYIRASEDRDKTEMGLKNASELIRRKIGSLELEEYSEELARVLVLLNDNFDLPNFYKMRESALVALVMTSPTKAAGVLTEQFYEKRNSMGQRLNILTALALGAQELSGSDRPPTAQGASGSLARNTRVSDTSPSPWSSTSTLVAQRPTFDGITSSISLARTRRFSQKSNIEASRPAPRANAFSNVAPVFLGGLLGRWGGNRGAGMERGYDVLQKAPVIVLKKFVMTLGVLVHYAGNSPHLVSITRELFRFLLVLRYHNPPAQATPGQAIPAMIPSLGMSAPSLTSLKLPGDIGVSARPSSNRTSGSLSTMPSTSLPYNQDLLESILFDLLILVTPSTQVISDELLLHEFYGEIMECQQWAMELWEVYKLEQDSGDKSRMYCAALLQRCFEVMKVSM
ncbi:telomere binding protein [Dissophora ornata]|nr:telomere binding protein [Dissophora ornata]